MLLENVMILDVLLGEELLNRLHSHIKFVFI